jgi:hypothetical protein
MGKKKKKSARNNRGKRKGRQAQPSGLVGTRYLLNTRLPAQSLSLRTVPDREGSAQHKYLMSGCEVIGEVRTSLNLSVALNPALNPSNVLLVPRLSAMALTFERYRLRKLVVRYHTAAPATRSGSMGLLIDFDPDDPEPASMLQLASNEAARIGTIASDLEVSATWPESDPWYLVTPNVVADATADTQWRYPGRLFVMSGDALSTDENALAGYISVEYEWEFLRLRPPTQISFLGALPTQSFDDTQDNLTFEMVSQIGQFGWEDNASPVVPGSSILKNQVVSVPNLSSWLSAFDIYVEAKSIDKLVARDWVKVPELKNSDNPFTRSTTVRVWRNPKYLPRAQRGLAFDEKDCIEPGYMAPQAAGDVTIKLNCKAIATGLTDTITSWLFTPGVGATILSGMIQYTLDHACQLIWAAVTPTGETRVVNPASKVNHASVEVVE